MSDERLMRRCPQHFVNQFECTTAAYSRQDNRRVTTNLALESSTAADRRSSERTALDRVAVLRRAGQPPAEIQVLDLTRDGCRIKTDQTLGEGEDVELGLPGVGTVHARVMWFGTHGYGCAFAVPLPSGSVTAATQNNIFEFGDGTPSTPSKAVAAKLSRRRRAVIIGAIILASWVAIGALTAAFLI